MNLVKKNRNDSRIPPLRQHYRLVFRGCRVDHARRAADPMGETRGNRKIHFSNLKISYFQVKVTSLSWHIMKRINFDQEMPRFDPRMIILI